MFRMPERGPDVFDGEPSARELAAIEAEWPAIEADLAVLDAEIHALTATDHVDELAVRRARRAGRRTLRPATGPITTLGFGGEAA